MAKYTVVDNRMGEVLKEFATKKACKFWLMEGLFSCDGSEMERYRDMLAELECGKKILNY